METFVVDTSVIVKWYNQTNESRTQQAYQILLDLKAERVTIIVPDIAALELLNVLIKSKSLSINKVKNTIKHLFSLPIVIKEISQTILDQTTEIMGTYQIAAYDALFVATAKYENCKLISDDTKAHGKITDGTVIMLDDYPPHLLKE